MIIRQNGTNLRFNWFSSESDFTDKLVVHVDVDDPNLLWESYERPCSLKEFDGIISRSLWIDLLLLLSKLENSVKCLFVKLSFSVLIWKLIDELNWSNLESVNVHEREGKFVDIDLLEARKLLPMITLSEAVLWILIELSIFNGRVLDNDGLLLLVHSDNKLSWVREWWYGFWFDKNRWFELLILYKSEI